MTIQEKQNFAIRYSASVGACFCCGVETISNPPARCACNPAAGYVAYCKACKKCPDHCGCTARIIKTEESPDA